MISDWNLFNIHTLANNAEFGLEYLLQGTPEYNERARKLLEQGILFCDILECGNVAMAREKNEQGINFFWLDAYDNIEVLRQTFASQQLEDLFVRATFVKINLLRVRHGRTDFTEERIREMQHFFDEAGTPYLRRAYSHMRRRHHF